MWRVWLRETRPLVTYVGGSVAGLAAFWLCLRVFALFALMLPFNRAAWLSYFVVTVLGLAAATRWRAAATGINEDHPFTLVALLAFASFFALSVYAASGALFSFDETMTHHLPLVASMQRGNFPPMDLREPPHPLEYHWGQHLLAAGVSQITGLAPWQTLFGMNALLAGFTFLLAYALARREVSAFAAACGAVLLVAGGTLNWLSAWRYDAPFSTLMNPLGQPFTTGNTIMGGFFWRLHTNSTTWPTCLLLLATDTLWRGVRERAQSAFAPAFAIAALLLALVAPGSETMLCAGLAGWLIAYACTMAKREAIERQAVIRFALAGLAAALLAPLMGGTLASFFATGSASHQARIALNLAHFGAVPSWNAAQWFADPPWLPLWSWRFLQDAGPVPFLLLPALILALRQAKPQLMTITCVALTALIAATTLTLTQYPANMFRLVNHAVVLGALPVAAIFAALCERHRFTRWLAVMVLLLLISAWPLSFAGLYQRQGNRFPWPNRAAARAALDESAIAWLRANTDFRDGLLPLPLDRWDVLAAGQAHPLGSFVGGRSEYHARAQHAAEQLDAASLAAAGIRYVYAIRANLPEATRTRLDEAVREGGLKLQWQSPAGDRAIYSRVE